jgi:hypothetical protein
MFEQAHEIASQLAATAAEFDPDALDAATVVPVWKELDRIERLAAAMKLRLARRVDEVEQWKRSGYASAADYLAAQAGSSVAAARDMLCASSKLPSLPVVEDALRVGRLSGSQAVAVTDAAAMAPTAQARLVNDAQRSSLAELRQECLRTKAAADRDREVTRERIHRQRYLRAFTDAEGARNVHIRGPVDRVARIEARLQPFVDDEFNQARTKDRHEEREAYAFDALLRMLDQISGSAKSRSRRNLMLIRADLEALKRGTVERDELCDIPGLGPIAVSAARELLGESILKLVITKGIDVLNVTHLGRGPTEAQRVALLFQQPVCSVEGCTRSRCEIDHRDDYARTHHTRVDECDPLCKPHHDLKTYKGWALAEGTGKRAFVASDDARHPNYKPPP